MKLELWATSLRFESTYESRFSTFGVQVVVIMKAYERDNTNTLCTKLLIKSSANGDSLTFLKRLHGSAEVIKIWARSL